MRRTTLSIGVVCLLALTLAATVAGAAVRRSPATGTAGSFIYIVGEDGVEGPDVTAAANGNRLIIHGHGHFDASYGAASGGGQYEIRNGAGALLVSGLWRATGLARWISYGTPGAPVFGGDATLRVVLVGYGTGLLDVTCLVGSPPPTAEEGVTFGPYTIKEFGQTLFVKD